MICSCFIAIIDLDKILNMLLDMLSGKKTKIRININKYEIPKKEKKYFEKRQKSRKYRTSFLAVKISPA